MGEHAHLSYAATAYGVQGATGNGAHTVLSEVTSAAGVYVGMTRGRETNRLRIVATDMADARAQFMEAMERDPADRGLDHATDRASILILKPHRNAEDARTRAAPTRAEANELRSLPVTEAAERIEAKNVEREHKQREAAVRERQLSDPFEYDPYRHDTGREGPTRGL